MLIRARRARTGPAPNSRDFSKEMTRGEAGAEAVARARDRYLEEDKAIRQGRMPLKKGKQPRTRAHSGAVGYRADGRRLCTWRQVKPPRA